MKCRALLCAVALATAALAFDESGPPVDKPLPSMKIYDVTGPDAGKELDAATVLKQKPGLVVFMTRWERPPARFLKLLDTWAKGDEGKGLTVLSVFLTDDLEVQKGYLPKVQTSLKLEAIPMTVFLGPKVGPPEYQLNDRADVTVVFVKGGKVVEARGIVSCNDTDVPRVVESAKKLLAK